MFELVVDRTQLQIIFQILERRFDFGELNIELPEIGRVASTQVRAQQIAAFAPARLTELLPVQSTDNKPKSAG